MPFEMKVVATINGKPINIEQNMNRLPADAAVALKRQMDATLLQIVGEVRRSTFGSSGLKSRTGSLLRSVQSLGIEVVKKGSRVTVEGAVGVLKSSPGGKYAAIQELGGTVVPTNAQYLTVPLPAAMSGGVAQPARSFDDTFVLKSKKGNLLIVQNTESGLKPLFVLKKSVTIPRRPYIRPAVEQVTGSKVTRQTQKAIGDFYRGAFRR